MRATPLAAILLAVGCGSSSPVGPSTGMPATPFAQHTSAHFTFQYTPIDATSITAIAEAAEAEHGRITSDLQVASMPAVTVFLYADWNSMQEAVQPVVGTLPRGVRGLVTAADRIHVLSPSLSAEWSYREGTSAIVHEFAHCVSLRSNATIGNNPRWLWEAVAVYEAQQFVDPRSVPSLASGRPPSLARLSSTDNTDVYSAGFVLGEFIVSRWGRDSLVALIRNNGNLQQTLALDEPAFMAEWYAFVRERYGL